MTRAAMLRLVPFDTVAEVGTVRYGNRPLPARALPRRTWRGARAGRPGSGPVFRAARSFGRILVCPEGGRSFS